MIWFQENERSDAIHFQSAALMFPPMPNVTIFLSTVIVHTKFPGKGGSNF